MTHDELDDIEEAYSTRIGREAMVIRTLVQAMRDVLSEIDAIDFALAGGYVHDWDERARQIRDLVERAR